MLKFFYAIAIILIVGIVLIDLTWEGSSSEKTQCPPPYIGDITVTTQAEVNALHATLSGKTIIAGNLTIGYTSGSSRGNITNLTPLSNIIHITGDLRIQQNGQLVNLNGLNNLQSIGKNFRVYNSKLTDLGDFSSLQSIGGIFFGEG